jgi:hypothetical protein
MQSSRWPVPVIFSLLLVLLVLSCGCGDYVPNHDVIIIGMYPDGTLAWSRTLDNGFDDVAADIVEAGNGDLMIAAGSGSKKFESPEPKLVRLAPGGTLRSEHPCPSLNGVFTSLIQTSEGDFAGSTIQGNVGRFDREGALNVVTATDMPTVWALAPAPDGGIAVAGQSVQMYPAGSVPVYGANGNVSTRAPLPNESVEKPMCRETILKAGDRKIPVTECVATFMSANQAALTLINRNGTIVWQKGYGAYGLESAWSLAAAEDGKGFYMSAFGRSDDGNANHRYAVHLDSEGSVDWITDLGLATQYYPSQWDVRAGMVRTIIPQEYVVNNSVGIRPELVTFDASGEITGRQEIYGGRIITPTADGGFFSAGFSTEGDDSGYSDAAYGRTSGIELHALKFRADGSQEWDRIVGDGTADHIRRVIQTTDGGYVIVATRENY